jgi:hypothetical protein
LKRDQTTRATARFDHVAAVARPDLFADLRQLGCAFRVSD